MFFSVFLRETGKTYIYFDADHNCILCMELRDDYLFAEREVMRNYPDLTPPFTREAPALFASGGKKYMLTSGMTGYVPNRSDSAVSDTWDGLFESLGDPHVDDASCASFISQISKIFRVEGTDRYIAMDDRWLTSHLVELPDGRIKSAKVPEVLEAYKRYFFGMSKYALMSQMADPSQGTMHYQYATAWPCSQLLAQTFDTALVEEVGDAVGQEMLAYDVTVWLAPGMNIHRNPLCGRTFEYYSEDPVVSGKIRGNVFLKVGDRK